MTECVQCGVGLRPSNSNFCSVCGTQQQQYPEPIYDQAYSQPPSQQPVLAGNVRSAAARGFGQVFALDPASAFLTICVDTMLFPAVGLSLGALLPVAIAVGAAVGYITYKI